MNALAKIFGSDAKVKILRLFLFNQVLIFDSDDVAKRAQISLSEAQREISNLLRAGIILKKKFTKSVQVRKQKKIFVVKRKKNGLTINNKFKYLRPLQNFLLNINPIKKDDIINKLSKVGKIKLLVLAGVFIQNWDSRADILLVGDGLKKHGVDKIIHTLEAQIGKELTYAAFDTKDFEYRMSMHDRLLRDILDYPNEIVVDRLGVTPETR